MHPGDSSNRATTTTTTTTHFLPPSALKSKPCRCRSKRRRRNQRKSSAPRARPPAPTNPQAVGHGDSSFVCDVCLMILKKQPPPIHQTQISLLGPWAMMMLVGLGRLGWLTTQDELLLRRAARIRPTEMVAEQKKKNDAIFALLNCNFIDRYQAQRSLRWDERNFWYLLARRWITFSFFSPVVVATRVLNLADATGQRDTRELSGDADIFNYSYWKEG